MKTGAASEVPEEGRKHGKQTKYRTARILFGPCKTDRTPPQTAPETPPSDDCGPCGSSLLAGGGAYGARQAWLQKHRQEYAEQGLACLESQNYAQAVTAFDDAIALTHGRIGTFEIQMMLYRAEAQYRSGDYQSALAAYETLYAKDDSNETCKAGLALCLLETGDYDRAKSLGVIQGQVYSRIAKDQINAGNYDDALSTIETGFSEAGADEVGREELTYNQAVAWEYKGDYKKALEILESYDQKYTAEGNAARELAFLKTRQGNH